MWEARFNTPDYVFGKAPAAFLPAHDHLLKAGDTALCVADGEGRNSVYLATRGLRVTALEYAPSAIAKARALAREAGVDVDFREVDVLAHDWAGEYDAVLGIFIQFVGPDARGALLEGMKRSTRPGGLLLLHGYTPEQIAHGTGGPPHAENMYTTDQLARDFAGWEIVENRAYEREIEEGRGHSGRSALIDFVARKPG
ncbi:cyclopropane-fatty-acyl-phospholipid synthase family protein [Sediminimonas sp.]|uniref:SAM-dependent methyltransferase n=1 Tax=Sediminimonas sp. TaxID=2823379 RepID=UPI0025CEB0C1|nr:class I SAM-dependent methyltransferase [Sediminimonas sp.]